MVKKLHRWRDQADLFRYFLYCPCLYTLSRREDGSLSKFSRGFRWDNGYLFFDQLFPFDAAAKEIALGMIPNIPDSESEKSAFLVIASVVGTTVFSGLIIFRTTLVKEAGWSMKDLKKQKKDALFSGFLMFVVSGTIMAAAAGTLFIKGIKLENDSEMITLLEPLAGSFAVSTVTVGLIAAGVSSQFPNVALLPWLLDDYYERKPDLRRTSYWIMALMISLLGLIVPVFNAKP